MQKSNIKNQNYRAKYKIFIFELARKQALLTFLIVILHFTFYILHSAPVLAQSPTPTPTSPAVKEIREKVKEIVREKIEEVKKGQKRAFVGEISQISNSLITVTNPREEQQIRVDAETKIIGKG